MADPFLHMVRSMAPHTQEAQKTLHRKNKETHAMDIMSSDENQ